MIPAIDRNRPPRLLLRLSVSAPYVGLGKGCIFELLVLGRKQSTLLAGQKSIERQKICCGTRYCWAFKMQSGRLDIGVTVP
jgi:hypothetical protein